MVLYSISDRPRGSSRGDKIGVTLRRIYFRVQETTRRGDVAMIIFRCVGSNRVASRRIADEIRHGNASRYFSASVSLFFSVFFFLFFFNPVNRTIFR